MNMDNKTAVLKLVCPERVGIIAEITTMLASCGINIVEADSHSEPTPDKGDEGGLFCARFKCVGPEAALANASNKIDVWAHQPQTTLSFQTQRRSRMVLLGSREPHCVLDLLERCENGELDCDVAAVISDRTELSQYAARFEIPFVYLPIQGDRKAQEQKLLATLRSTGSDLIVLARYMRILPSELVDVFSERMINIHHSTLPAFVGTGAYERAHERGVKLIGATAHYVTTELDSGPIISQSVIPVSHRDDVGDLKLRGRDVERTTLAHAVRVHLEDRCVVVHNRCVVFE